MALRGVFGAAIPEISMDGPKSADSEAVWRGHFDPRMNDRTFDTPSGADWNTGDTRCFGYPIRRYFMFRPIGSPAPSVTLFLDGQPIMAHPYETVAACLLRNGISHFRTTPVSGSPRLPYCMIGQCFDCLVEIESIGSSQACLVHVKDGLQVFRLDGAARAGWGSPE